MLHSCRCIVFECLDSNFCLNSIGLSVQKKIGKKDKPSLLFPLTPFPFGPNPVTAHLPSTRARAAQLD
jgi:hypothetical protein